jgi:spore maturation protein CgeB
LQPQLILTFTHAHLLPGALAQIRAAVPSTLVQIWPDTMQNWAATLSANVPLYDLVATYSRATVPIFERMGARRVAWLPLAGDPELHPAEAPSRPDLTAEVSFIGGWRPERESVLSQLEGFDLKIWGPDWGRRCRSNQTIMKAWQGRALRGVEFAQAVRGSKLSLNIIDPANFPAANMRFFEIPVAGGLQVCSPCPEMEIILRHGEHLFYYQHPAALSDLMHSLLTDAALRKTVATAAHEKVLAEHTYLHRARQILELFDLSV